MRGVILYGPPAAGKDTVTSALHRLEPRFQLFRRLKVGGGKQDTYRVIHSDALEALRRDGEIVWENSRYGATYAIDRTALRDALRASVPVLHLGQPEAVAAVLSDRIGAQWVVVELRCSREVAASRLVARDPSDVAARLAAWDETAPLKAASLRIDTGVWTADQTAWRVRNRINTRAAPGHVYSGPIPGVSHLSHVSLFGADQREQV